MTKKKIPTIEYKRVQAAPIDVVGVIAEEAISGWEPVCVYPTSLAGESTMQLLVTRFVILFRKA